MECRGRQTRSRALVAEAAPAFALILRRLARLDGAAGRHQCRPQRLRGPASGLDARVVGDVLAMSGHDSGRRRRDPPLSRRTSRRSNSSGASSIAGAPKPANETFFLLFMLALAPALGERVSAESGTARAELAQGELPELTAPVNDFAGVIDRSSKRATRCARAQAAERHRRRDGGGNGQDVPAVRGPQVVHREAVREPRQRHRREGQGQRRADRAGARRSAGHGSKPATASRVSSPTDSPARPAAP